MLVTWTVLRLRSGYLVAVACAPRGDAVMVMFAPKRVSPVQLHCQHT